MHSIIVLKVDAMLAKYDWIVSDRPHFGQANTAYDFSVTDPKEAQKKIEKLQQQKVISCLWKCKSRSVFPSVIQFNGAGRCGLTVVNTHIIELKSLNPHQKILL